MIQATIRALVETIVHAHCDGADHAPTCAYEAVAGFVIETTTGMPDHLYRPFTLLTLLFGLSSIPTAGRPFHLADDDRRRRQLDAWRASRLGPCRDLMRYYQGLTVFGWYAEHHGEDYRHDCAA